MHSIDSTPRRIVISRPDRVGDVVISSSCFAPLKRALPHADIFLLAQPRMAPLFHNHPLLSGFIAMPSSEDPSQCRSALEDAFRKLSPDCIVHLHPDPVVEQAADAAGIPCRIGFCKKKNPCLTEFLTDTKKLGEKHEGYYNFDLLKLIGVLPPQSLEPSLSPDPAARDSLAAKLARDIAGHTYAVFHIGAHEKKPRITPEIFSAVARSLISERNLKIILVGMEEDAATGESIVSSLGKSAALAHNFCGRTTLAEVACLLGDATVVFGRDSGPAHIAAALGTHTVTLMLEPEPENSSRRWTPLGPHSIVIEKPLRRRLIESRLAFARRNLRQFTPDEIAAEVVRAANG